jgi:RNA-directed DNA polymerase
MPSMSARARQALYLRALEPLAATRGDPHSYGFRPARSPAEALAQGFNGLAKRQSPPWSLAGDIRACGDTSRHAGFLAPIPMEKAILQKWWCAGYLARHVFHPTEQGAPQGGTCSPVRANLTRDGLEPLRRAHYPKGRRAGKRAQVNVIRFADDCIVTGRTKALLEEEVKPLSEQLLRERGLDLAAEKPQITHLGTGWTSWARIVASIGARSCSTRRSKTSKPSWPRCGASSRRTNRGRLARWCACSTR